MAFCGRDCQVASWPAHRASCRADGAALLAELRLRAAGGVAEIDADACLLLASVLEIGGLGVSKNPAEAAALRERAAQISPGEAALRTGRALAAEALALEGPEGAAKAMTPLVADTFRRAIAQLRLAAAAGKTEALEELYPLPMSTGEPEAVLAQACAAGSGVALRWSAMKAVAERKPLAAMALYERGIAAGDMHSAANLATLLWSEDSGLALDYPRAVQLLSVVADQPTMNVKATAMVAKASYNLFALLTGRATAPATPAGVEAKSRLTLNLTLAAKYLEASAALGDAMGQTELGLCLLLTLRPQKGLTPAAAFSSMSARRKEIETYLTDYGRSIAAQVPTTAAGDSNFKQNAHMFSMELPRAEALLRAAATHDHTSSLDDSRKAFIEWQPRAWWALSCVLAKVADLRNDRAGLLEAKAWLLKASAAGNALAVATVSKKEPRKPWFINMRVVVGSDMEACYAGYFDESAK